MIRLANRSRETHLYLRIISSFCTLHKADDVPHFCETCFDKEIASTETRGRWPPQYRGFELLTPYSRYLKQLDPRPLGRPDSAVQENHERPDRTVAADFTNLVDGERYES